MLKGVLQMYNLGDIIIVTETFKHDGCIFNIGDKGQVVDLYNKRHYIGIHWLDGKKYKEFHSCGGTCPDKSGYNIDLEFLEGYTALDMGEDGVKGNPLPTDPRLRGIALKIIQLDIKFKRYQELKKSGQLYLLNEDDDDDDEEDEDEWEEDYDLEDEHIEYRGDGDYETVRG